jgi:two-component system response regulator FixJ
MKAGAVDFLEKPFSDDVMLAAVAKAMVRFRETSSAGQDGTRIRERLESLSERERQVLSGLLMGHPNKTIAFDLDLSPRTVEVHRANVMTKMGASSLSELVRMALQAGIS